MTQTSNIKNEQEEKKREKKSRTDFPSKVVVRHLPPAMTEEMFFEAAPNLPPHDYFCFVKADPKLKPFAFGRAYINFLDREGVIEFSKSFNQLSLTDAAGNESSVIVEFAPFQKTPRPKVRKRDAKIDTIEDDPDFIKFQQQIEQPDDSATGPTTTDQMLEEIEAAAKMRVTASKTTTPLIDFLKQKKEERKSANERLRIKEADRRRRREEDAKKRKERERQRILEKLERREEEKKRRVLAKLAREKERKRGAAAGTVTEGKERQEPRSREAEVEERNEYRREERSETKGSREEGKARGGGKREREFEDREERKKGREKEGYRGGKKGSTSARQERDNRDFKQEKSDKYGSSKGGRADGRRERRQEMGRGDGRDHNRAEEPPVREEVSDKESLANEGRRRKDRGATLEESEGVAASAATGAAATGAAAVKPEEMKPSKGGKFSYRNQRSLRMKADLERANESDGVSDSPRSPVEERAGDGDRLRMEMQETPTQREDEAPDETRRSGRRVRPERAIYQPGALRGRKGKEDEAAKGRRSPDHVPGVTRGTGADKESSV